MRIDKFLKTSRIIKRRTVAKDIVDADRILVNDKVVKPSYQIKIDDIVTIIFGTKKITIKVLNTNEYANKSSALEMYEVISEENN